MPKPLDERIAAAMGAGARVATIAELIAEVAGTIAATQAEHDRQDALSKSVSANEDEADAAADEAAKLSRKIVRLTAKKDQLEQRHEELMNSERRRRAEAEYDEVKARRDQLAADLADRWPALVGELVDLVDRIKASDAECERVNSNRYGSEWLSSAEAIARGCPGNFVDGTTMLTRFAKMKVPSLRGRGSQELAWPRWFNPMAATEASNRAQIQFREQERVRREREREELKEAAAAAAAARSAEPASGGPLAGGSY